MQITDFVLNKAVTVEVAEGNTVQGILKGLNEDYDGKVTATVEYMIPTRQSIDLNNITIQ